MDFPGILVLINFFSFWKFVFECDLVGGVL